MPNMRASGSAAQNTKPESSWFNRFAEVGEFQFWKLLF
jgi:hypothetical protein